jgi:hypothetical protein
MYSMLFKKSKAMYFNQWPLFKEQYPLFKFFAYFL